MEKRTHSRKGKHAETPQRNPSKHYITLLSIALILSFAVIGSLSYIATQTGNVKNRFAHAHVTCQVNANSDNTFDVMNTSNVDVYIRAAIVVNWMDSSGNIRGIAPETDDYDLVIAASQDWTDSDPWYQDAATGFYYHKVAVTPRDLTEDLITSIRTNVTPPIGYTLRVEVVAEAIQAEGDKEADGIPAFQDAWGVTFYGN